MTNMPYNIHHDDQHQGEVFDLIWPDESTVTVTVTVTVTSGCTTVTVNH